MLSTDYKGRLGEKLALNYLVSLGYEIIEQRARVGHFEIDIIAKIRDKIVFVEVRFRSMNSFVSTERIINRSKLECFQQAILAYISQKNTENVSADLIIVYQNIGKFRLVHYVNIGFNRY